MPDHAVLNGTIITPSDIYKFNICKTSPFLCSTCGTSLHFRQSRNADTAYTEHFFHPNTVKDTRIECERNVLKRHTDTWHATISNFIVQENREIIRKKHIVDAYDGTTGIEFQNSPISVEDVQSRDATTHLDWIFNVENQYIRHIQIGNIIACEIPHENWEKAVKVVKNNLYMYTGCKEWILLEDRESYRVQIDGKIRNVWIGKPCIFENIHALHTMLTDEGLTYFQGMSKELTTVRIMYARCKKSMFLLDDIHRQYVALHQFQPNEIMAIKSVAGSGKTTTLIELAKIHSTKKILYLAFNKALITYITSKNIPNLFPSTFHSLVRGAYVANTRKQPDILELRPDSIHTVIHWFKDKPFAVRKSYVDLYTEFCRQPICSPQEFSDKPLLNSLWRETLRDKCITFDSLIKLSHSKRWLQTYIDDRYDMIMIDETQDLDRMMLDMVLNDTTVPRIFVGDPKQSIYTWRGCINGFEHLPPTSLILEFYSTFRIGDPACERIREKFNDCWMISKSSRTTELISDMSLLKDENYTYLFRTWRCLLQTARQMKNIWIYNYEEQVKKIRKLHTGKIHKNDEFPDDLPRFVKSLSKEALDKLISDIENNITSEQEAVIHFYTIHSYKGLEDDIVRLANDIHPTDENVYYVALTRGKKYIIEDSVFTKFSGCKPCNCSCVN